MTAPTDSPPRIARRAHLAARIQAWQQRATQPPPPPLVAGRLQRVVGLTLEAVGCQAPVGGRCVVLSPGEPALEAEVVGFGEDKLYLMPISALRGLTPAARVLPLRHASLAPAGPALLGRVLGGNGAPLDELGPLRAERWVPLAGEAINPLRRAPISQPLNVGIRAINALLSVGRGQRLGLFAGSGVGKSVLLGMMTRYTEADVTVVGLIGERGREVAEFVSGTLDATARRKAVVVASPADDPPLMRLHGAWLATAIAESFRDQGLNVLLLMDSLTRVAQAQREIALAIGEPPATKGYPPSVFARLPQLVERAGNGPPGGGSITAFYTVLAEGDDQNDPVVDAARAILDGHIVLSRELAESGHFPAIDVEASVSRVMPAVADAEHLQAMRRFRRLYSTYRQHRDLIAVGAYHTGADPQVDAAVAAWPALQAFLQQDVGEGAAFDEARAELLALTAQAA
ncbi:MAG: flagellar protein export ATPase FliI [Pseudomonadota bacterium]|nr:flagellar protein export ATPase FliI [Pseudomonadota bacterium]HJO35476.1 flagellar protein export ATPase FliI [Gammaproteobacteria bacterium]